MSETAFPEVPATADALAARWAERDAQYAQERTPMSWEQAETIRLMRMREAGALPQFKARARMYARAKSWVPPLHPDFGGLRDWMND
jgi:hypothetical protein